MALRQGWKNSYTMGRLRLLHSWEDLNEVTMAKIETFNYFRSTTEKWRQKELKRLERKQNQKNKKRNRKY
jgi:hypothetical protein